MGQCQRQLPTNLHWLLTTRCHLENQSFNTYYHTWCGVEQSAGQWGRHTGFQSQCLFQFILYETKVYHKHTKSCSEMKLYTSKLKYGTVTQAQSEIPFSTEDFLYFPSDFLCRTQQWESPVLPHGGVAKGNTKITKNIQTTLKFANHGLNGALCWDTNTRTAE